MKYFIFLFLFLASNVSGQDDFTLSIDDFFGVCDHEKVGGLDFFEIGKCVSNFINPSLNYELLISPFEKLYFDVVGYSSNVTFKENDGILSKLTGFFTRVISLPLNLLGFFMNFGINFVRFALHFIFRFAVVYFLWICIGFQVLLNLMNSSKELTNEDRVNSTFFVIIVGTIWTMAVGLGGLL